MSIRRSHVAVRILGVLLWGAGAIATGQESTPIFREAFDSARAPALPAGWRSSRRRSSGQDDFTVSTTTPHSPPNAVLATNATIAQMLTSPTIDLNGVTANKLSFYLRRSSTYNARLLVEASPDTATIPFARLGDTLNMPADGVYSLVQLPLGEIPGRTQRLTFRWSIVPDSSGASGTLRMDDITVSGGLSHDLALVRLALSSSSPAESSSVTAQVTVKNAGMLEAAGFEVKLFLDRNRDLLAEAGELVGSGSYNGALPHGDSVLLSIPFSAPEVGDWLLIAAVVSDADQDSSNNLQSLPITVGPGAARVVINEIMYAPPAGEPEWIELFNPSRNPVSLRGWSVSDADVSSRHVIGSGPIGISGQGFLVLTRDSAALAEVRPEIPAPILGVPGFPSLNNGGDAVILRDQPGNAVDSVRYSPAWGGNTGGRSLERIDPLGVSVDSTNWLSSADTLKATPGRPNSRVALDQDMRIVSVHTTMVPPGVPALVEVKVKNTGRLPAWPAEILLYFDADADSLAEEGEVVARAVIPQSLTSHDSATVLLTWERPPSGLHLLCAIVVYQPDLRPADNVCWFQLSVAYPVQSLVVNEIMFAPFESEAEYVEVYNPGPYEVDLHRWAISDFPSSGGNVHRYVLSQSQYMLRTGGYFVIASDSSIVKRFPTVLQDCKEGVTIVGEGSLNLKNDGDAVVLSDLCGHMVDSVAYLPAWHNPAVLDCTERSLERVQPRLPSNDRRNWNTCVDRAGGTPGRENSIFTRVPPSVSRLSCSPNPFSPDSDGRDDYTVVHYEIPVQSGMMNMKIFDARGRQIRTLANNELCGPRGDVLWDGRNDAGRTARIGIYVVTLEAISELEGAVISAKTVVVLAGKL